MPECVYFSSRMLWLQQSYRIFEKTTKFPDTISLKIMPTLLYVINGRVSFLKVWFTIINKKREKLPLMYMLNQINPI